MKFKNWRGIQPGFLLILLLLSACQSPKVTETPPETEVTPTVKESSLSLYNAILEQASPEGQTLWKIKSAETIYSPDRKFANLKDVIGNFWQDNQMAIYLTAQEGEVKEDGKVIILKNNVIAKDVRNGTVIKADELTWYPEQNLLILTGNLASQHPDLNVTAKTGKYYSDKQELELIGEIIANNQENLLQFSSSQLRWNLDTEILTVNAPLEIVRYDETKVVTERVVAEELEVDFKVHQAKFRKNVEFISWDPVVQIASNSIIWNYQKGMVVSDQPVQIIHQEEELTITGNRGYVDLEQKIAHLQEGVTGQTPRNQANLYATELIWSINTQEVEAKENVIYEQIEPYLHLTGDRAVGRIQDKNIVVTSDKQEQVITEIKPSS